MKPEKDTYGMEIWDYLNNKTGAELIERDDGYIDISSGAKTYFSEYKNWKPLEKKAIKLAKGKVLDIGCGAGRISLYLQKKGFNVTAIDNSPLAIKTSKKRGVEKAKVLPIENLDNLNEKFDTILMFGNNFGLFANKTKSKSILKAMEKITTDNAIIIAESNDPYKTDNKFHKMYHKFNKKRGRMPGQIKIRILYKIFKGDWFDYLFVSKKEMKTLLKGTGWKIRKFIDSGNTSYFAIIEKSIPSQ